jgi:hypothetical protein
MEEIDVEFGGFNMKKPPNNPPNSENLQILNFSIYATCARMLLFYSCMQKTASK